MRNFVTIDYAPLKHTQVPGCEASVESGDSTPMPHVGFESNIATALRSNYRRAIRIINSRQRATYTKRATQNAPLLKMTRSLVFLSCRRPQNLDCPLRMLRLEHAAAGNEYVRSHGDNLFRIVFGDAAVEFD